MSSYSFKGSPYSSHSLLLSRFPAPGRGRRVLDLGSSSGFLARILAGRGYDVTGVERPEAAGPGFPPEVRLIHHDLDLGLPQLDAFDYVLCADILEHLRDPASLLRRIHSILAPGGALIASLPNSGNLHFRLTVLSGRFPKEDKGLFDRTHLHFFPLDGWLELFGRAGYRFSCVSGSGIPVGLRFPRWENSTPVLAAETISYGLARIWKRMFAYQFIVEARPVAQ